MKDCEEAPFFSVFADNPDQTLQPEHDWGLQTFRGRKNDFWWQARRYNSTLPFLLDLQSNFTEIKA